MPRILLFLGWFCALFSTSVAAQKVGSRVGPPSKPTCTVSGTVTLTVSDLSGARIPNAFVLLRPNRSGNRNAKPVPVELRTDSAGIATGSVPCGYADLFVAADGFAPQARKLSIDGTSLFMQLQVYPNTEQ